MSNDNRTAALSFLCKFYELYNSNLSYYDSSQRDIDLVEYTSIITAGISDILNYDFNPEEPSTGSFVKEVLADMRKKPSQDRLKFPYARNTEVVSRESPAVPTVLRDYVRVSWSWYESRPAPAESSRSSVNSPLFATISGWRYDRT